MAIKWLEGSDESGTIEISRHDIYVLEQCAEECLERLADADIKLILGSSRAELRQLSDALTIAKRAMLARKPG